MTYHDDNEEDSNLNESEFPDSSDTDGEEDDDSADTEPCPHCHRSVYDQASVCPHCGSFISPGKARSRKPLWIIVGAILCLLVVLFLWLR